MKKYWLWLMGIFLYVFCNVSYSLPPALPKLVIILDDLGNDAVRDKQALRIPAAITYAVLPYTPSAITSAKAAYVAGKEIILHTPMEAIKPYDLGKGGLYHAMGEQQFITVLNDDLNAVPFIRGLNNHMGSRLTASPLHMMWLMQTLQNKKLYFIDSATTPHSVAEKVARQYQIPVLHRHVFLDNIRTEAAIRAQFERLLKIADKQGYAVAIGHPYPQTLAFLEKTLPQLSSQNYELLYGSQLINYLYANYNLANFYCVIASWFCNKFNNIAAIR